MCDCRRACVRNKRDIFISTSVSSVASFSGPRSLLISTSRASLQSLLGFFCLILKWNRQLWRRRGNTSCKRRGGRRCTNKNIPSRTMSFLLSFDQIAPLRRWEMYCVPRVLLLPTYSSHMYWKGEKFNCVSRESNASAAAGSATLFINDPSAYLEA